MRTREEIEELKNKVSGGLWQKERENAMLDLLMEIRDRMPIEVAGNNVAVPVGEQLSRPCYCEYCKGKDYVQVDPVGCECTECITGEYRPAMNEKDYKYHNN